MARLTIAVFGTGATGGYFGGRLAEAGEDVRFIARGAHLAAMRERGLRPSPAWRATSGSTRPGASERRRRGRARWTSCWSA